MDQELQRKGRANDVKRAQRGSGQSSTRSKRRVDDMAAILKTWHHSRNPTLSVDAYLLEDNHAIEMLSRSYLKRRKQWLFEQCHPKNNNNKMKNQNKNKNKMIGDM